MLPELPHELMAVGGLLAAAIAFVATIVWLYRRTVSRGAMRVRGAFAALDDIELLDLSTATREGLSALARVGAHPDAELWIEGAFLRVQKIGFLDDVEVLDALVRAAGTIAVALGRSDATR